MHRLTLASLGVPVAMGQQVYERELEERTPLALGPSWEVRSESIRTLRSPLPGSVRLPHRLLSDATGAERAATGRWLYHGADLVHRLDLRLPPGQRETLTIHDVVFWRFDDEATPPRSSVREARRALSVVCPSEFSADEVRTLMGVRNVVSIPNGVDARVRNAEPMPDSDLSVFGLQRPFVLHTGGCTLRKNLPALAEAWTEVRKARPHTLLGLVGPPDTRRDALFGPLEGAVILGRLSAEDLNRVRSSASALVVPSIYEGFGLPALEGMAASVPVVASRRSSLPEVCGDAALLVEPTGHGLAEGLIDVLDAGTDVARLVERGLTRSRAYTWEASATAHAKLWRHLVP